MNRELISQSLNLFNDYEKWNAFIELSSAIGEIRNLYFGRLKSRINELTNIRETVQWNLLLVNNETYRWYINAFGQNSICLNWDCWCLKLWCNPELFDATIAKELLTEPHFLPIKNCFDYLYSVSNPNTNHFFEEKHRYIFIDGSTYFALEAENHPKLSWFAGNKTDEMAKLIMDKVNKFRTPEITELLIDLNNKCRRVK